MNAELLELLRCPACDTALAESENILLCEACNQKYNATGHAGQWDLRLAVPRRHIVTYHIGEASRQLKNLYESIPVSPSGQFRDVSCLTDDLLYGNRLTPELISHFPNAAGTGGWMLDLGCGSRNFESICREVTGFNYVGIDYEGSGPDLLADAHALPFKDESFEFILSVAVLEHLAFPDVAMAEAFRVLKPGGVFIGTVAFLEPFHMDSYYHMTHLGTARSLEQAGFEITAIAPNLQWSGTRAQAEMTLFPGLPLRIKRYMTSAVTPVSKAMWGLRRLRTKSERNSRLRRLIETTGGYRFVVRRPLESSG
jgi:SAM-dependent methyltransferase